MVKNLPANTGNPGLISGSGRPSGEGNDNPVFLPGEFHGQRSLAGYCPWGCKESDMTEQLTHTHTHTHKYMDLYEYHECQSSSPRFGVHSEQCRE